METTLIIILSAIIVLQYIRNKKIVAFKNSTIESLKKDLKEYENSYYCLLESNRKLQHKANRLDAEMERQRVKNRKYRERKKAKKMTAKEIAEKYLGVEVGSNGVYGKICGYWDESIVIGLDNNSGWIYGPKIEIKTQKYRSYWYINVNYILPQLKNK